MKQAEIGVFWQDTWLPKPNEEDPRTHGREAVMREMVSADSVRGTAEPKNYGHFERTD